MGLEKEAEALKLGEVEWDLEARGGNTPERRVCGGLEEGKDFAGSGKEMMVSGARKEMKMAPGESMARGDPDLEETRRPLTPGLALAECKGESERGDGD